MQAIFISYRRDDSEGQAGRLFDDLVRRFGSDRVFMDVAGIQPGLDFRKIIDNTVTSCGVLLALIGPHWLDAKDEAGNPRLDNPSDFVRLETAAALKRDIPVIPVLVQGARMPRPEQLPEELGDLVYRNSSELTHARWDSDVEVLTKALEKIVAVGAPLLKRRSISRRLGLILAILAGASVIGLIAFSLPVGRVTQKPLAEVPSSAVTPVPQNFAGTWQLVSEDWKGVGERPGFTLTQDGDVVSIIGWKGLKGKLLKFKINAEGKAVNRTPYAADMTLYRPNKSAQGPAEVFRIVLSLEANKLVYEDSFQYNVPVAGHPVGTETRIQRYERIPPN